MLWRGNIKRTIWCYLPKETLFTIIELDNTHLNFATIEGEEDDQYRVRLPNDLAIEIKKYAHKSKEALIESTGNSSWNTIWVGGI